MCRMAQKALVSSPVFHLPCLYLPADHSVGIPDHLGRRLRKMAACLLRTGELPENNQGMGANHPTLLNQPDVMRGLKLFVVGAFKVEEGGFVGPVSILLLPFCIHNTNSCRR